jgi:tetratricopeptide (TPR) repeat protein
MQRLGQSWKQEHPETTPSFTLQALLVFIVDDFGHFSNIRMLHSSGEDSFDEQAQSAIISAGRMNTARLSDADGQELAVTALFERAGATGRPDVHLVSTKIASDTELLKLLLAQEKAADKAIQLNNDGVRALTSYDFPLAMKKFEQSLKEDPNFQLARQNLAIAYNNEGLQGRGDLCAALKLFHMASFIDSDNITTEQNMNGVIAMMGKDPKKFGVRLELGDDCLKNDELKGAVVEYSAALKIEDNAATHKKLGDVYQLLNENAKASEEFAAAARQTTVPNSQESPRPQ